MGALVVAPADMQSQLFCRNVLQGMIQGLDVKFRHGNEFLVTLVFEKHMAAKGQVGTVDLDHQSGFGNSFVFDFHCIRESIEVTRVIGIMLIGLKLGDDSRGSSIHESIGCFRN